MLPRRRNRRPKLCLRRRRICGHIRRHGYCHRLPCCRRGFLVGVAVAEVLSIAVVDDTTLVAPVKFPVAEASHFSYNIYSGQDGYGMSTTDSMMAATMPVTTATEKPTMATTAIDAYCT